QESFYNAFSDEVLQAVFNTDKDEARKLFQGRNDYVFVKVSQEQIKALLSDQNSKKSGSTPYNIFNHDLSYSNIYGKLYEINPQDYQQIQDLDIQLTYANITKGAMFGPYHNTRSATIAMVIWGKGYFQVACPHLSQQQGASYNASAKLLAGDNFVVPNGYPVVIVNS
ncbi:cupin domain-containing protein, partial [Ralstonia pseudosolanacearum]|uniref:cupin domain-containing protein n=1 Tax=Ralstonia pseudosolanacearum TaxID=1310165 RepID=UPI003D16E013